MYRVGAGGCSLPGCCDDGRWRQSKQAGGDGSLKESKWVIGRKKSQLVPEQTQDRTALLCQIRVGWMRNSDRLRIRRGWDQVGWQHSDWDGIEGQGRHRDLGSSEQGSGRDRSKWVNLTSIPLEPSRLNTTRIHCFSILAQSHLQPSSIQPSLISYLDPISLSRTRNQTLRPSNFNHPPSLYTTHLAATNNRCQNQSKGGVLAKGKPFLSST